MTDPAQRLAHAEREAAEARDRLSSTLSTIQTRLDPRTIARSTVDEITDRGTALAKAGADGAQRHPGAVKGIAALAGLFFVVRPIVRTIRARTRRK